VIIRIFTRGSSQVQPKIYHCLTIEVLVALRMRDRPDLRATGRVVAILEQTSRRQRVVGVLQRESKQVVLIPVDLKLPKCHVRPSELPDTIKLLLEVSPPVVLMGYIQELYFQGSEF